LCLENKREAATFDLPVATQRRKQVADIGRCIPTQSVDVAGGIACAVYGDGGSARLRKKSGEGRSQVPAQTMPGHGNLGVRGQVDVAVGARIREDFVRPFAGVDGFDGAGRVVDDDVVE
jgi:hypothetical protein